MNKEISLIVTAALVGAIAASLVFYLMFNTHLKRSVRSLDHIPEYLNMIDNTLIKNVCGAKKETPCYITIVDNPPTYIPPVYNRDSEGFKFGR